MSGEEFKGSAGAQEWHSMPAGADSLFGGDDGDLFTGLTARDIVDGGEGGCDNDTLDLRAWGKAATNII
jgi:hypothetical protein